MVRLVVVAPRCAFLLYALTISTITAHQDNGGLIGGAVSHFESQVAMLCDAGPHGGQEAYHPKYMNEQGNWVSDLTSKVSCFKDKMDILSYCKKVYPKRDITNIVESSHYLKIGSWCKVGSAAAQNGKCKTARWVKPFRCLEGPFQSDALLVPENCLFDHIHNQSNCWTFGRWNATAGNACQDRGLALRSFAMLLPCGISLFSGVEFVCCPKHFVDNTKAKDAVNLSLLKKETDVLDDAIDDDSDELEDEDEKDDIADLADDTELADPTLSDDDDEDIDDYDETDWDAMNPSSSTSKSTTTSTTTTTTTSAPVSAPDPYFTHFDPRNEHQSYKEAQKRLEETHREKVTKVMKDWSDLEERYQDMRQTDPRGADDFKQRMTRRFQQTVQALEEEGDAEKHQLAAMHQQRVLAHINQRKKEAMTCYTQALNEIPPNTHRVQKCLQKVLRALHKDRAHAITHYRHLLASSVEAAAREQPRTLERLLDIDRTVNQSMQMLKRYPALSAKIEQLMDDYIQALRSKDETPGSLLAMTTEAEQAILNKFKYDIASKQAEKERLKMQEKERKEQRKKERMDLREEKKRVEGELSKKMNNFEEDDDVDEDSMLDEKPSPPTYISVLNTTDNSNEDGTTSKHRLVDDQAVQQAVEDVAAIPHRQERIRISHSMTHEIGHEEPSYSIHRDIYGPRKHGRNLYFTLAFAGVALMATLAIVLTVMKRRNSRSPKSQGFIEVDQAATPEERHVANMQVNGYENPTYKYFEVKE